MYTDIPHSIHSLCAIVACKNVNLFFVTFFKFFVFFSKLPSSYFVGILSQFFYISDEIHVLVLNVYFIRNCYKKMSLKNPKILRKGSEKLQPQMSELQSKIADFS